jgi:autotransporter translocation and assembly factor TamB
LHLESPNLADLSARLVGTRFPVTGSASADVAIDGTRAAPRVAGRVSVKTATVRGVAVPQAAAAFVVRGRDVVLSDATVDFASGTLALDGSVPFEVGPLTLGPETARVDLTLAARNIALANFTPLLPAGSILRGTLGGAVTVGGTIGAPRLGGRLTLAAGTVQTPYERVPLTGVAAAASFDGDAARLDLLHASAGGGTLDAAGSIRFADLVRPGSDATYAFVARAGALHLDLPAYGSGTVDGTLSLGRVADGVPRIAGDLRLSDGTIPFSALISAGGAAAGGFDTTVAPPAPAPGLAFDLDVSAVRNVRVRSANIDIGGRGDLHVGGTLGAPQLAGGFTSTGGTITYFNTVFRLIDGTVTFAPELGVVPTLDARGVTHVINPDPNTVRNLAGTADVTLSLLGPVTNLTIGLSSDPSYDRQQILGLLLNAPALGASNLFGETRDQATLYGSNATATLPPGVATFRSTTGELSVAQEAFGIANAQFTRTLLAPIESTFASAVGLSNFNVNVDYTGNVGVSARKVLGKSVNAVYGSSFGYPYRQTFGFEVKPSPVTAAQVTVFDTLGQSGLSGLTPTTSITNSGKVGIAQPFGGTTGFSLSFQRLF